MKTQQNDFSVLKEEISQNNVLTMAEFIAIMEVRFQIGYMGSRMQKMYADLFADIKHKHELCHTFSDSYDLVQEGALFLCEHYGKHLSDILFYSKNGKVGQYIDYVFPAFGIRFIAIQDNVDTENRDSGTMEMMPIMNVFNEWHAANTSKKIRAVRRAFAKEGVYIAKKASYGYKMGTDKKRAPIIDEETAPVVKRI